MFPSKLALRPVGGVQAERVLLGCRALCFFRVRGGESPDQHRAARASSPAKCGRRLFIWRCASDARRCFKSPLSGRITMKTFCILCTQPIPPHRQARRGVTCSDACAKEYRRQARQDRAEKKCRLCGRRFRTRKPAESDLGSAAPLVSPEPEKSRSGLVLSEHSRILQRVRR